MPPVPKPATTRQRRNRTTTAASLEAGPAVKVALPDRQWQPATVAWWDTIWASPMVGEWVDADVPGLLALAVLVDAFWAYGDPRVHAEMRQASREFGLSPLSRRQLQWEIKRVQAATRPAPAPADRPRGRAALGILDGGKARSA